MQNNNDDDDDSTFSFLLLVIRFNKCGLRLEAAKIIVCATEV